VFLLTTIAQKDKYFFNDSYLPISGSNKVFVILARNFKNLTGLTG
jgi:hypothetical protein